MIEIFNKIISAGMILGQVFLLVAFLAVIFNKRGQENSFVKFLRDYSLKISALVVAGGIIVTLIYTNVIGYPACNLCWLQRLFLYPQIIFLAIAKFWQKKWAAIVALIMSVLGIVVALYHNYIDYGGADFAKCEAFGTGVSCVNRYVYEFNYITIPMMSLTAFLLLTFFLSLYLEKTWYNNDIKNNLEA